MNLEKIGKFIAECRKNKKLTQEQLAEKLYITDRAVSKWERGLSLPDAGIMLDLCDILEINVNELLNGEKIDMKDYKTKNEELLLELAKQDEMKNKKIFSITIIASIICVMFYLAITLLAAYTLGEGIALGIIMVTSTAVFITALFIIFKFEVETGYHECKYCKNKFIPTYFEALVVPHIGYSRYLKCPKCHKRSFTKKVMKK